MTTGIWWMHILSQRTVQATSYLERGFQVEEDQASASGARCQHVCKDKTVWDRSLSWIVAISLNATHRLGNHYTAASRQSR